MDGNRRGIRSRWAIDGRSRQFAFGLPAVLLAIVLLGALVCAQADAASWKMAGQDLANSRTQPSEFWISPNSVNRLKLKWSFADHGDESATPAVALGAVYFPDWGGYLNTLNANTGEVVWQRQISEYDGIPGAVSRVTPAVSGSELILGDNFSAPQANGAHVFAVNRSTGALMWSTQVDAHPAAIITASPVVVGNEVIVGVSSDEEPAAEQPTYPCCTFRGEVVALNANTGALLWKTYTVPENTGPCASSQPPKGCGYSGGAVWATPAVDPENKTVYVVTGNNYTAPDEAVRCQQEALEEQLSDAECTSPEDHFDSMIALSLETGHVLWSHKTEGWDATNDACLTKKPWCPSPKGPDFDFGGGGPNLFTVNGRKLVGAGQKSGVYWAFDATTGELVWSTLAGPGSDLGGIEWGTSYDGQRIYVPEADVYGVPYELAGGKKAHGGSWAALDPATGSILWQVPTPWAAAALGPVTESDGVVYVGSMASATRNMFALSAATGKPLWSFAAEGSVNSGPAIANGMVLWGSGYPLGKAGTHLYAFTLGGH
jgi:polyvinyl alcohol dehydrogenase (cytochrome)